MDLKTFVKYILDRATPEGAHFSSDHGKTEREILPLGTEERERERERARERVILSVLSGRL